VPFAFLIFGAAFGLLFLVSALARTLRGSEKISFFETLLAFLTALLPLAGWMAVYLRANFVADLPPLFREGTLVVAATLVVVSAIIAAFESRRPQRMNQSRGVLGIGVGALIGLAAVLVPLAAGYFAAGVPDSASLPTPVNLLSTAVQPVVSPTLPPDLTGTPTRTPLPSRTPRPTNTPTSTRAPFATPTPQPTVTLPNPCLAIVNYNLRLRTQPNEDSDTLLVIPYSTTITLYGRSEDSVWWYALYNEQTGWVKGEFLNLSASCDGLPVHE